MESKLNLCPIELFDKILNGENTTPRYKIIGRKAITAYLVGYNLKAGLFTKCYDEENFERLCFEQCDFYDWDIKGQEEIIAEGIIFEIIHNIKLWGNDMRDCGSYERQRLYCFCKQKARETKGNSIVINLSEFYNKHYQEEQKRVQRSERIFDFLSPEYADEVRVSANKYLDMIKEKRTSTEIKEYQIKRGLVLVWDMIIEQAFKGIKQVHNITGVLNRLVNRYLGDISINENNKTILINTTDRKTLAKEIELRARKAFETDAVAIERIKSWYESIPEEPEDMEKSVVVTKEYLKQKLDGYFKASFKRTLNGYCYFDMLIEDILSNYQIFRSRRDWVRLARLIFESNYFIRKTDMFSRWSDEFMKIIGKEPLADRRISKYEPNPTITKIFYYLLT